MMVSKVAVMAIVGILAVPILLGYALNVEQVTETDYKVSGDSVNVTPLLQQGTIYNYAMADVYKLNTDFEVGDQKVLPRYVSSTSVKSSFNLLTHYYTNQSWNNATQAADFEYFYEELNYDPTTSNQLVTIWGYDNGSESESMLGSVNLFHSIYYNKSEGYYQFQQYRTDGTYVSFERSDVQVTKLKLTTLSGIANDVYVAEYNSNRFVDLSSGFKFQSTMGNIPSQPYTKFKVNLPDYTRSVLITINLSSISSSSYVFPIAGHVLTKTTTDGVVKWTVSGSSIEPFDLYYNQGSSNNTYQIKINVNTDEAVSVGSGMYSYPSITEFRYVGAWPKLIGEANYYQKYTVERDYLQVGIPNFNSIGLGGNEINSPIIRIDAAEFRAFEYPIIDNLTYNPASFKTNPSTTIENPNIYGVSFVFGGNTYTVKNGNITIDSHKIPVNGIVLSSVPNPEGGYDNKIGNTIISNTPEPSNITFNGKWSASISTTSLEEYEITKTEWKAGDFAWNGMDENFLMVGLLASLGAFIALGIYARRSRASIWPLLIVCGGAALMFFIML